MKLVRISGVGSEIPAVLVDESIAVANIVTDLDVACFERLVATVARRPGARRGGRAEQSWTATSRRPDRASRNRTCEISVTHAPGEGYRHALELLEEATRE